MSRVFFKKDFFKFTPQGSESQPTKAVSKPKTDDKHQIPSEQRTEVITQQVFKLKSFVDDPEEESPKSHSSLSLKKGNKPSHYGYQPTKSLLIPEEPEVPEVTGATEDQNVPTSNADNTNKVATKKTNPRKKKQQKQEKQPQAGEEQDKAEGKDTKTKKERRIKKQPNMVRLDLKRKYEQKFRGALQNNRRMFTKNGRLKDKYIKTAASSELEIHGDGIYNSFVHSLSSALTIKLSLDQNETLVEKETVDCMSYGRSREELKELVNKVFGYEDFRFGQFEVVRNILDYKSTLFISETGSGKSLTYILGSLLCTGMAVVVSPLISLMLDQIQSLPKQLPGVCIHSHLSFDQKQRILKMIQDKKVKLLYITPEALETDLAYKMRSFPAISFVCIDEAHCISELSHNFRTSYLSIHELIKCNFKFENGYCALALTASANEETAKSIMHKLEIKEYVRSSTLQRSNLKLTVSKDSGENKYPALLRYLKSEPIHKLRGILVYCRTYAKVREVCNYLKNSGISCAMFFSQLSQKEKVTILNKFREGQIKVIASTIALGMGLDFANLDSVIHLCMPSSVENYVQEIGRAGRRGHTAYCHMFLDQEDYLAERGNILAQKNDEDDLRELFKAVKEHTFVKASRNTHHGGLKRDIDEEESQAVFNDDSEYRGRVCYINIKDISEKLDIKQESIITILLKMEELSKEKLLKVLAPSYEVLEIGFFGNNEKKLRESHQLYQKISENSRQFNGKMFVRLIDKCNSMGRIPSDLLGELQAMADEHFMRIEKKNNVLVWKYMGEMTFEDFQTSCKDTLVKTMKSIQDLQLLKLNTLYLMGYLNSYFNMAKLLEYEVGEKQHKYCIEELLDQYFTTAPQDFYKRLSEGEHFLPIYKLEFLQIENVKRLAKRFLQHEGVVKEETSKYLNGKIATNMLLGISTPAYNVKKYGEENYFGAFRNLEYKEVIVYVREAMAEYLEDLQEDD